MDLYVMGRATGKTTRLAEWAAADPERRVMVVPTQRQAEDVKRRYRSATVMSAGGLRERLQGKHDVVVGIDELAATLSVLIGARVEVAFDSNTFVIQPQRPRAAAE